LNSIFALYYYLGVLKTVYLSRGEHEQAPIAIPFAAALVLAVCAAGILLLGIAAGPGFEAALGAVRPLFR